MKLKLEAEDREKSQDATSPERIRRRPFCIMLLPPTCPREAEKTEGDPPLSV